MFVNETLALWTVNNCLVFVSLHSGDVTQYDRYCSFFCHYFLFYRFCVILIDVIKGFITDIVTNYTMFNPIRNFILQPTDEIFRARNGIGKKIKTPMDIKMDIKIR